MPPAGHCSEVEFDVVDVARQALDPVEYAIARARQPAALQSIEAKGRLRDSPRGAELTGDLLDGWPKGMRLIVRKERPHRGSVAAHGRGRHAADLFRHQQPWAGRSPSWSSVTGCGPGPRTLRAARATGLRNLPLHRTAQNRIRLGIVRIALDLLAWMPTPALIGKASL